MFIDFMESVESGVKNQCYIDEILESAKLLEYLYRSSNKKQEVSF